MFTYGLSRREGEGRAETNKQTNKAEHRSRRCVQLTAAVIDDKVSLNVLKRASGQMHQTQAETQINTIFLFCFPFSLPPRSVMNKHDKTSASVI